MRTRLWVGSALVAAAVGAAAWAGSGLKPAIVAQPEKKLDPAEEEILKNAENFVKAFNKGDAKAVAQFWTEKGVFTDVLGVKTVGREALEKSFGEFFAEQKGVQLRVEVESIRFLTPDVAEEVGITAVIHPDGLPPSQTRYTNVHVRKDGKWYLDSVHSTPYAPPSNYENLKMFEGLIGAWEDAEESDGLSARITFEWTENQNFLTAEFTTAQKGVPVRGGTAWIGWDPIEKTVRTWQFESNGGFGQGMWMKADGKWMSKSSSVTPDGHKLSVTNVVAKIDANTISWGVQDRMMDGKKLPDIKAVKMKRVVDAK